MLQKRQARETGICPVRRELYSQCFGKYIYILYIVLINLIFIFFCFFFFFFFFLFLILMNNYKFY